jgi:hypothetical protein
MDAVPEELAVREATTDTAATEKKTKKEAFASLAMRMMFDISIGNPPPSPALAFVLSNSDLPFNY